MTARAGLRSGGPVDPSTKLYHDILKSLTTDDNGNEVEGLISKDFAKWEAKVAASTQTAYGFKGPADLGYQPSPGLRGPDGRRDMDYTKSARDRYVKYKKNGDTGEFVAEYQQDLKTVHVKSMIQKLGRPKGPATREHPRIEDAWNHHGHAPPHVVDYFDGMHHDTIVPTAGIAPSERIAHNKELREFARNNELGPPKGLRNPEAEAKRRLRDALLRAQRLLAAEDRPVTRSSARATQEAQAQSADEQGEAEVPAAYEPVNQMATTSHRAALDRVLMPPPPLPQRVLNSIEETGGQSPATTTASSTPEPAVVSSSSAVVPSTVSTAAISTALPSTPVATVSSSVVVASTAPIAAVITTALHPTTFAIASSSDSKSVGISAATVPTSLPCATAATASSTPVALSAMPTARFTFKTTRDVSTGLFTSASISSVRREPLTAKRKASEDETGDAKAVKKSKTAATASKATAKTYQAAGSKQKADDKPADPAKRIRIGQACDMCRQKKTKCDGKNPCGACAKRRPTTLCVFSKAPVPVSEAEGSGSSVITTPSALDGHTPAGMTSSSSKVSSSKTSSSKTSSSKTSSSKASSSKASSSKTSAKPASSARPAPSINPAPASKPSSSKPSIGKSSTGRVSQACDQCRQKKLKCNGKCICDQCEKRGWVNCSYGAAEASFTNFRTEKPGSSGPSGQDPSDDDGAAGGPSSSSASATGNKAPVKQLSDRDAAALSTSSNQARKRAFDEARDATSALTPEKRIKRIIIHNPKKRASGMIQDLTKACSDNVDAGLSTAEGRKRTFDEIRDADSASTPKSAKRVILHFRRPGGHPAKLRPVSMFESLQMADIPGEMLKSIRERFELKMLDLTIWKLHQKKSQIVDWSIDDRLQEESFHNRPSIKLVIPDHLKGLLVDDWENVTKNQQVVELPHTKATVDKILEDYLKAEKPNREDGSMQMDVLEETIDGIREYFDKALGRILLYKFERLQYADLQKTWTAEQGPSTTYGAEHLARLLVSLPELIAQTNMDQQSVSRLREELTKFTNWLAKNYAQYFQDEYSVPDAVYTEKARVG